MSCPSPPPQASVRAERMRGSHTRAALNPSPRQIAWWALGPSVIVVGGSLGAAHDDADHPILLVGVICAVAALTALTALIRPRLSVLTNGAVIGAYCGLGLANGPIFLTVPLVVFLASQRTRPRPLLQVLLPALMLMLAGLAGRSRLPGESGTVAFWQGCGVSTLALAAGVLGWWLTDRRTGRWEQAQRTAIEERLRMAQDLHDGVGHGLAVISMHAAVALHVLDKGAAGDGVEERLRRSLEVIRDTGRESLDALRVQLAAISTGPEPAVSRRPAPGLPDLEALLARVRTGGLVVVRHGQAGDVPDEIGQAVYAVVQESLTNVLRHARAGRASVTLDRVGAELVVSVQDNGQGPGGAGADEAGGQGSGAQSSGAQRRGVQGAGVQRSGVQRSGVQGAGTANARTEAGGAGMGIPGMRQRVERLGGTLESGLNERGFLVRARLPVPS
jgi:signal transduction histidine kinase